MTSYGKRAVERRLDVKNAADSSARTNVWFWKKRYKMQFLTFVTHRSIERINQPNNLVNNGFH